MIIKFNDGIERKCENVSETMFFKDGIPSGWLFCADIYVLNSLEVEQMISCENMSNISLSNDLDTQCVGGLHFESVNGVVIDYKDIGAVARVQLKRSVCDDG